jgi:hypothetical protein
MDTTADVYMYAGVRMMATEEVARIVGIAIQAGSIAVTAYFASRGLSAWRKQLVGKRRCELAEEILTSAFTVEQRIRFIRNGMGFKGEGKTRPRLESEPDQFSDTRDMYFIPLERISKHDETLTRFETLRVLAQAHWGSHAGRPFDTILSVVREVAVAARMLVSTVGDQGNRGSRSQWELAIWDSGPDDALRRRVNDAVRDIESLCRQFLR